MIQLHQFPPLFGLPNISPFCMKLETYLKMANIEYENVYEPDPRKAPKGKFPYIVDGTKVLADSGFIIKYLSETYDVTLDKDLSEEERAIALMLTSLFEEQLLCIMIYTRWVDKKNFKILKKEVFASLPMFLRGVIPIVFRRKSINHLKAQGFMSHSQDEIYRIGVDMIEKISQFLGTKKYFLGRRPSSVDAVAYGFLANILYVPFESPLKEKALTLSNLDVFCSRMKRRYYSDEVVDEDIILEEVDVDHILFIDRMDESEYLRIVRLQGNIDSVTIPLIDAVYNNNNTKYRAVDKNILLDFSKVCHVDSATIALLIVRMSDLKSRQYKLGLINLTEDLIQMLDIFKKDDLFLIFESEEYALQKLNHG